MEEVPSLSSTDGIRTINNRDSPSTGVLKNTISSTPCSKYYNEDFVDLCTSPESSRTFTKSAVGTSCCEPKCLLI